MLMKHIFLLLLLTLFPPLLLSEEQKPSYYIQTENTLSAEVIIENERELFAREITLLREAIQPGTSLWVKTSSSDQSISHLLLQHNAEPYINQQNSFYHIQNPSLTLLISLESFDGTNEESLVVWISSNAFYYGVMLALLFFLWFFYSFFQHKSFRYYLYFHLSFILLLLDTDGWLQKVLWQEAASLSAYTIPFFLLISMFLMILFTRKLLATQERAKAIDYLLLAFGALNLLSILLIFFAPLELVIPLITALAFATSLILLMSTLYILLRSEIKGRKSNLIVWAMLLIAIMIEYLRYTGILPSNLFTLLVLKITLLLELIIISLSLLSGRITHLEKEQAVIQTHLKKSESQLQKKDLDQERLQHRHDLLNKLAGVDSLTGLYNRREFFNISESLIFGAKNTMSPYALMMLDLDHFKKVNDTYGHDAGDTVLKEVTKAINEHKRSDDIFGRIGGEEFAIFLPKTNAKEAELLANKLCLVVEKLVVQSESQSIPITVSIGVTADLNYESTLSELMKSSDIALYEAKEKGRNCVVVVDSLPR